MMARVLPRQRQSVEVKPFKFGWKKSAAEEQRKGMLEAGLAMGALRFGATLLKPIIVNLVTKQLRSYAGGGWGGKSRAGS